MYSAKVSEFMRDVLIVDDDKDIVDALTTILNMEGFSVRTAYNGADCLKEVRTNKPAIVLLDLMLPDISGKDVAKTLASELDSNAVPIIIISAAREAKETAKEVGAKACIEKPFDLQELINTVNKYQLQ